MHRRGRGLVSVVTAVAVLLVSGPAGPRLLRAAESETVGAVRYSRYLEVKPGELKGRVLYPDGKTPAAEVPVRVWSPAEKKFIYEGKTDKQGNYTLPALKPGRYLLIFGDRVTVDLRVTKTAAFTGKPLNVFIPRGRAFFAPEEMEVELVGGGEATGGKLLTTLLIVGGGAATAVGIVALAGGFEEEEEKVIVSP